MIFLLLPEFEAKLRVSVNNKDIVRMYPGYNWLITQKYHDQCFLCEPATSKQWLQVMFTYVLTIYSFDFFPG